MTEWKTWPGFSRYEASHRGKVRSIARGELRQRPNNRGYLMFDAVNDEGVKKTVTVHTAVLLAHGPERKPGEEACHGLGGQQDNRYPENLSWGTKAKNNGPDKDEAGTQTRPTIPCRNHDLCGGYVFRRNTRCADCVKAAGIAAGDALNAGENLLDVAERLGYSDDRWLHRLAAEHGGYRGSLFDARRQRPGALATLRARGRRSPALATLRARLRRDSQ